MPCEVEISVLGFNSSSAMKAKLKLACLTLISMCLLPWMRYMTLSDIDSIINNSSVGNQSSSIEDLEPSTITELLSEMRKGSMQREFLIEKHAEKSWQVAISYFYFYFFFLSGR